jgi:hypothetical protein
VFFLVERILLLIDDTDLPQICQRNILSGRVFPSLPNNKIAALTDVRVSYVPLLQQIAKFMRTGVPPVSTQETLKIFSFLDAAQRSRERGGIPIRITQR